MTWLEFKKAVEEQDVKDSDELFYLDLYPSEGVNVSIDEDASGAAISSNYMIDFVKVDGITNGRQWHDG